MKNFFRLFGRLLLVPISWMPLSRLYGRIDAAAQAALGWPNG